MKTNWKKYAPYGLYLSIAALIVSAGLFIVFRSFNLQVQISLGIVLLGLLVTVALDPQKTREIVMGRQMRYTSNAVLFTIAAIGILTIINYIAFRVGQRWDLTQDQNFTLTKETINVLDTLPEQVKVEAFFTPQLNPDTAKRLLDTYKYYSKGKFDYEFIDPNTSIVKAQNAKISRDGTLVFTLKSQQEQVTGVSEEEYTSALLRLTNPGKRAVYFLTGHGEPALTNEVNTNLSMLSTALQNKNYTVSQLNLLSDPKIPADALAVIVVGPQMALTDEEVGLLKTYLQAGGGLVYLSDPPLLTKMTVGQTNPLDQFLADTWSIKQGNNIIIDPGVQPPIATYSNSYGKHTITSKLSYAVLFPTAHSVTANTVAENMTLTPLIFTSQNAWGETDFQSLDTGNVSFDPNKDLAGPVSVAVAAADQNSGAKIVVIGDSDFAKDKNFATYGNADFIINSIDWAAKQDNLLNLTPKNSTKRTLIPPQDYTFGLILLSVVFIIPGLIIAAGIASWIQRRNKG